MSVLLWEDEPDQNGRIPDSARHVHRLPKAPKGRKMMASGKTGQAIRVCSWCGKGMTHSDDVLLALDTDAPVTHGIHPECRDKHLPEAAP